ncbi:MAG: AmmeMemoRadiSam system radical SAM enzyme [Candidatus Njordarchaeia archaeon]
MGEKAFKYQEKLFESPCFREALLWEKIGDRVRCNLCYRRCIIPDGKFGMCGTRINIGGKLYTVTFGNISSISNNPMSKKPFYHFKPDKYALTVGSWSCNFVCPWCQNFDISKVKPHSCNYVPPDEFISLMKIYGAQGTSFSFNEPSISLFEYSLKVMEKAKKLGYFNTYVTNGYITPEAIDLLVEHGLDAVNIDVKGCPKEIDRWIGADVNKVFESAKRLKEKGVHVEITTLIIPHVNDREECLKYIAKRILRELGEDTPWHVTRYYAAYKSYERGLPPATPISAVKKARQIGLEVGLKFVYTGNFPNEEGENTYCPNCGELLIKRTYPFHVKVLIDKPVCPKCGEKLPIIL